LHFRFETAPLNSSKTQITPYQAQVASNFLIDNFPQPFNFNTYDIVDVCNGVNCISFVYYNSRFTPLTNPDTPNPHPDNYAKSGLNYINLSAKARAAGINPPSEINNQSNFSISANIEGHWERFMTKDTNSGAIISISDPYYVFDSITFTVTSIDHNPYNTNNPT